MMAVNINNITKKSILYNKIIYLYNKRYMEFDKSLKLNEDDFIIAKNKKMVKNNNNIPGLIFFYVPWCSYCAKLKQDWIELENRFKNLFNFFVFNCEEKKNAIICDKLNIKFYPTIRYISKKGNIKEYKGIPNKEDLLYFVCAKI